MLGNDTLGDDIDDDTVTHSDTDCSVRVSLDDKVSESDILLNNPAILCEGE